MRYDANCTSNQRKQSNIRLRWPIQLAFGVECIFVFVFLVEILRVSLMSVAVCAFCATQKLLGYFHLRHFTLSIFCQRRTIQANTVQLGTSARVCFCWKWYWINACAHITHRRRVKSGCILSFIPFVSKLHPSSPLSVLRCCRAHSPVEECSWLRWTRAQEWHDTTETKTYAIAWAARCHSGSISHSPSAFQHSLI